MYKHPSQQRPRSVVLIAAFALSSCGGGGGGDAAQPSTPVAAAPRPITQSDLQIAQDVYAGGRRTPSGFYSEDEPSGHDYVSTVHLKNGDLGAADASQPLYELCTNDWNEALAWSEATAQQSAQYADLVETNDDARFFEFGRARPGDPEFYVRARVFKCAYLDRSAANLREASGPAGRFNHRPLTASDLKGLSEYLWQFTTYNNFGNVVLESAGEAGNGGLAHTLHIASLVRAGMSSACDRIDVIAWRHDLSAETGALELSVETLWSFGARESAGVAELCSG